MSASTYNLESMLIICSGIVLLLIIGLIALWCYKPSLFPCSSQSRRRRARTIEDGSDHAPIVTAESRPASTGSSTEAIHKHGAPAGVNGTSEKGAQDVAHRDAQEVSSPVKQKGKNSATGDLESGLKPEGDEPQRVKPSLKEWRRKRLHASYLGHTS